MDFGEEKTELIFLTFLIFFFSEVTGVMRVWSVGDCKSSLLFFFFYQIDFFPCVFIFMQELSKKRWENDLLN